VLPPDFADDVRDGPPYVRMLGEVEVSDWQQIWQQTGWRQRDDGKTCR
jgi:hypothetical protein